MNEDEALFRLSHKGVLARWLLDNLSSERVAATWLMDLLERVGYGEAFIERAVPGNRLADELAWTVNGLGGSSDGLLRTKRRWLPVGEFEERRAAWGILGVLADSEKTATMPRLVRAAELGGIAREPFCVVAGWMLVTVADPDQSEPVRERRFREFWKAVLSAA